MGRKEMHRDSVVSVGFVHQALDRFSDQLGPLFGFLLAHLRYPEFACAAERDQLLQAKTLCELNQVVAQAQTLPPVLPDHERRTANSLSAVIESLHDASLLKDQKIAELSRKRSQLMKSNEDLEKNMTILVRQYSKNSATAQQCELEKEGYLAQISHCQKAVDIHRERIHVVENENKLLYEQLNSSQTRYADMMKENHALQASLLNGDSRQLETARRRIKTLQDRVKELNNSLRFYTQYVRVHNLKPNDFAAVLSGESCWCLVAE
jgi:hypothetical protein